MLASVHIANTANYLGLIYSASWKFMFMSKHDQIRLHCTFSLKTSESLHQLYPLPHKSKLQEDTMPLPTCSLTDQSYTAEMAACSLTLLPILHCQKVLTSAVLMSGQRCWMCTAHINLFRRSKWNKHISINKHAPGLQERGERVRRVCMKLIVDANHVRP